MISQLVRLRAWGSEDNEIVILIAIRVGLKPRLHTYVLSPSNGSMGGPGKRSPRTQIFLELKDLESIVGKISHFR